MQLYLIKESFSSPAVMDLRFYIKSVEKMRAFCSTFQLKNYLSKVKDLNLAHLQKISYDEVSSE